MIHLSDFVHFLGYLFYLVLVMHSQRIEHRFELMYFMLDNGALIQFHFELLWNYEILSIILPNLMIFLPSEDQFSTSRIWHRATVLNGNVLHSNGNWKEYFWVCWQEGGKVFRLCKRRINVCVYGPTLVYSYKVFAFSVSWIYWTLYDFNETNEWCIHFVHT